MTNRKKPGVAFWATMILSLPVLYVLSFGPACWIAAIKGRTAQVPSIYLLADWSISSGRTDDLGRLCILVGGTRNPGRAIRLDPHVV